ncbi:GTPase HflX [candidate division KSB1 bacterium 4484_87]|nr:MAG: GTPase HflX [candidate division KSB1 bacterium 4484_87]
MLFLRETDREKAIIVGVIHSQQGRELLVEYLDELELLLDTAGADVVRRMVQERKSFDSAYLVGKGFAMQIKEAVESEDADMVVFDDDLTPAQVRNFEQLCKTKIMDRSGIILDIFARRARTREAKTQVELAQLQYFLPRLTRMWTHLSRQSGGAGIGLRGPGEKQLEVDRRIVRKRITTLRRELEKISRQREIRRSRRKDLFNVALLGYTNVGKSTLMNALTQSDIFVEDRLFATLDSTVRQMPHSGQENILLIDTVGFVRKLPHHLVASFKSTLEETRDADLLIHVVDASHPYFRDQMKVIRNVMRDLKLDDIPSLLVFNKIDKIENKEFLGELKREFEPCFLVSAQRQIFIDQLKEEVINQARAQSIKARVKISLSEQKKLSSVYEWAKILQKKYEGGFVILDIEFPVANKRWYYQLIESPDSVA